MKKPLLLIACLLSAFLAQAEATYQPTEANLQSRQEFADMKFGIFIHWGIYSVFGQGEWFMNRGMDCKEYAKAADAFYPHRFDAEQWVAAIKGSGAKYITITSRHHDGFSMFGTKQSPYNIVDATPFKRDVLKELSEACQHQGIRLHFYYSHVDWTREDYPWGNSGHLTGRDSTRANWPQYYRFMNAQLTELLTNYGPIGAIWFDGYWDHAEDSVPFDWQLPEQYALIHRLQPACLVGNNHHDNVLPGEDIQIFERDIPGRNTAGYSGQDISVLPLETCQTMNGMWGYKVTDQNYKTVDELIRYLVETAGKGANLLLNIGPQPNGELPAAALDRLKGMGEWLATYGDAIYGTTAGDFQDQPWGTSTRKGDTLFLHVLNPTTAIDLPLQRKLRKAYLWDGTPLKCKKTKDGIYHLLLPAPLNPQPDCIIRLTTD